MRRRQLSRVHALGASAAALLLSTAAPVVHAAGNYPVTADQRSTAQQVAQAGVPLAELAPNAPDRYTVKRGDTLWDISKLYLNRPWRWPELWGMNLEQIRNPHLIYPGQVLVLEKVDGRARLRLADGQETQPSSTAKLSPRIRVDLNETGPISGIPLHLIQPFLNEAIVFDEDALKAAPRIVASREGRVELGTGDTAYVRGELGGQREFRVFRNTKPLVDPATKETLGYEARFLGAADLVRPGGETDEAGKTQPVPATFMLSSTREEVGLGDRLAPVPPADYSTYAPHSPGAPITGQIVSVYGDALNAGQNQIVALNKGARDGVERGHVLALWHDGPEVVDRTSPTAWSAGEKIKLPDEREGLLFVFRVFDRVSYALILQAQDVVKAGDRFTQP